jgi:polyribonucleotide nucleotidyltransferase
MLTQKFSKTFDIGDGREVTIETGRLARQADGSVTVRMGNSILLATVVRTQRTKRRTGLFSPKC